MKISVVIPTYGRSKLVLRVLERLTRFKDINEIIVVVDEDKITKDTVSKYADKRVKLIFNKKANGLPSARNQGSKLAKGDVVIFLDDDAIPRKGWLEELLKPYEDKSVGGVGGSEIKNEEDNFLRKLWFYLRGNKTGRIYLSGEVLSNFTPHKDNMEFVDTLVGCNMSFRKEVVQKLDFDTNYKGNAFREETDYCFNVKKIGYKLVFNPNAKVRHYQSSGGVRLESLKKWCYWESRNTTYFFLKNIYQNSKFKWWQYLIKQNAMSVIRCIMYKSQAPYIYFRKGLRDGIEFSKKELDIEI